MKPDMTEQDLTNEAKQYLKSNYDEATVAMEVIENNVEDGRGVLHVDCTVSVNGSQSNWTKWFTFNNGKVTDLRAKLR